MWYLGRSVRYALKEVTTDKAMLNAQKSAEVIVREVKDRISSLEATEKGGMTVYGRKH